MKHYYLVQTADLPSAAADPGVECHWLDLASFGAAGAGKHVLVAKELPRPLNPNWTALPHLLDNATIQTPALISALWPSAPATITGYGIAKFLASIHPAFNP